MATVAAPLLGLSLDFWQEGELPQMRDADRMHERLRAERQGA